ncbi:hypothetical protein [uncultured Winogradskyella sp.]|uniref:hypothetical protein n=1 Tax=uncultured Winogradskyella sp. TaxID=395353 RepID=UPI002606EE24|nr:hypothetical protein [uncultured Winogradskyella sp.]
MNYKDVFAIDSIAYNKRETKRNKDEAIYQLNNYNYYEPKLDDDFYLKYFTHQLLLVTDIMELEEFLEYHYNNCNHNENYVQLLDLKVLPKIEELIENAQVNLGGRGYFEENILDDGFVETEGVIKNWNYDYPYMLHYVAAMNLQKDLVKRFSIILGFLKDLDSSSEKQSGLIWKGKPSHLAFFIAQFIQEGYIDPPRKRDGDINNQELSKIILNSFKVEPMRPSIETLKKYCNTDSERYVKLKERFSKSEFHLPNSKIME